MDSKPPEEFITREYVEQAVRGALDELYKQDLILLKNEVSERAITHMLAEYLQVRFQELNVDCEYNRDLESGLYAAKKIYLSSPLKELAERGAKEEELLSVSTFPDIIVHRRGNNDHNILVIEVKKKISSVDHKWDDQKLHAFTDINGHNNYGFKYGVFVLLGTRASYDQAAELTWYEKGKKEPTVKHNFV